MCHLAVERASARYPVFAILNLIGSVGPADSPCTVTEPYQAHACYHRESDSGSLVGGRVADFWQCDGEGRPDAARALKGDRAPLQFDKALGEGEFQARAVLPPARLRLRAERLEE